MLGKSNTYSRTGMLCRNVEVEVDMKKGLPVTYVTGMLSQEVKEAKERIRPAIINSGFDFPLKRITINLSPAETVKYGTHYDLAIAIAILNANQAIPEPGENDIFFGELNLSGDVKWVRGLLPMVLAALKSGAKRIFVPEDNMHELVYIRENRCVPVRSLKEAISQAPEQQVKKDFKSVQKEPIAHYNDFSDIRGQDRLVRACCIAAAGSHHMLIVGPPGAGKTMAAARIPGIMPPLTDLEIMEINMIHSIASLGVKNSWITTRPVRTPHHSSSSRAITGGGPRILPGEVSLAHKGILFLDEFLEFRSDALQALRTIIEKKEVYISLRNGHSLYPADFLLVAAANPCACGYYDTRGGNCSCSLPEIKKYRRKLNNPLTDRIDLQVKVDRVEYKQLTRGISNQSSKEVEKKVNKVLQCQQERYKKEHFKTNSSIPPEKIEYYSNLSKEADSFLDFFMEKHLLTARACHKIIGIARTIADIDSETIINTGHIEEALEYRFLDIFL